MAVNYPLTFPSSINVKSMHVSPEQSQAVTNNEFNFKKQVVLHQGGARWKASIVLPQQERDKGRELAAFLTKLQGQYGYFRMGDLSHPGPAGAAKDTPGSPRVRGVDQTGDTLQIDGCPVNLGEYLKEGDYFQLGNNLYMTTDDVVTNASGQATLNIWPRLRSSPADNAVLDVSNPEGLWRLATPVPDWTYTEAGYYQITLSLVEYI